MKIPVGLKFRPTEEEIFDDYLRPKNLDDDTSHVDQFISTVTICSFDPWELPCESRIKLKDREWCFFSLKEKKYNRGEKQVRKTRSGGYWKITGKPSSIFRKSGDLQKIGEKRVLMFFDGKKGGTKSDWVMHEYHLLLPDQMIKYSLCKLIFKGQEIEIPPSSSPSPSSSSATEIEHFHSLIPHVTNSGGFTTVTEGFKPQEVQNPRQFSGILDEQQEPPMDVSIRWPTSPIWSDDWDSSLARWSQIDDLNSWLVHCEKSEVVSVQDYLDDFKP